VAVGLALHTVWAEIRQQSEAALAQPNT